MKIESIFLTIINMSITAGYIVLLLCIFRLFLKKIPKKIPYLLWGIVFFRLVCPFSFESMVSLIPRSQPIPIKTIYNGESLIAADFKVEETTILNTMTQDIQEKTAASKSFKEQIVYVGAIIWIIGVLVLLFYSAYCHWVLKRKISTAIHIEGNIYYSDVIDSPFVYGLISPKIYLPFYLSEQEKIHVLLHEKNHIKRGDYIAKPVYYIAVLIHWFNPLAWLSFDFMSRDMEMACDEAVMKQLGEDSKKEYCNSLLNLTKNRPLLIGEPLAFGESNIKQRVKNILHYKKPITGIVIFAAILSIIIAFMCSANPVSGTMNPVSEMGNNGEEDIVFYADITQDMTPEKVLLDISKVEETQEAVLEVYTEADVLLWSETAGIPHAGWNSIYLYEKDGEKYFLRYNPYESMAGCHYSYQLFSLDDNGNEMIQKANEISFEVREGNFIFNGEEIADFMDEMNELLSNSFLLLSTQDMELSYSTNHSKIHRTEDFKWLLDYSEAYNESDSLREKILKVEAYLTLYANQQLDQQTSVENKEEEFKNRFFKTEESFENAKTIMEDEGWRNSIVKLAEIPEYDIKMYGYNDETYNGRGVFIQIGEDVSQFDWVYLTPSLVLPEMYWDEQKKQLQVVLHTGSGTSISVDELYVLQQYETGHLEPAKFEPEDYVQQLEERITYEYDEIEQKLTLLDQGEKLQEADVSWLEENSVLGIYWGTIINFEVGESIIMKVVPAMQIEDWFSPQYDGIEEITAVVEYDEGFDQPDTFTIRKIE